jgi:hypothetical protein
MYEDCILKPTKTDKNKGKGDREKKGQYSGLI